RAPSLADLARPSGSRTSRPASCSGAPSLSSRSSRQSSILSGTPRGMYAGGSSSSLSGVIDSSTSSRSTPETPSIMQCWTLLIIATRPPASPSTVHTSQSGLPRSSCCEAMRAESRLSCRSSPGRGRLVWRTWYARLKRSSSTHTGCPLKRHVGELLAVARNAVQPDVDELADSLDVDVDVGRRERAGVEDRRRADVHVAAAVLVEQERLVERGQPLVCVA